MFSARISLYCIAPYYFETVSPSVTRPYCVDLVLSSSAIMIESVQYLNFEVAVTLANFVHFFASRLPDLSLSITYRELLKDINLVTIEDSIGMEEWMFRGDIDAPEL